MKTKEQKQKRKEYLKKWREKNKCKLKEYRQRPENKTRRKEYNKAYNQRPEVKKRNKESYQDNKEIIKQKVKEYSQKPEVKKRNKEYIKKYYKEYSQRQYVKENRNNYLIAKRNKNLSWSIKHKLKNRLSIAFNNYSKTGKVMTSKKYGIDYKAIIEHLKPFPKDISKYHIDHIIPLSLFDFNNLEHIKIAFAPTNHRWLTKEENMKKGNKLIMSH